MTKEMSRELQLLLDLIKSNIEAKAYDTNLTGDQVACLLIVADAIDQTIKNYF